MAKYKTQNKEQSKMTVRKGNKVVIRKGYSSSANPEKKKFREQAAAALFGQPNKQSAKTWTPQSQPSEDDMSDTVSIGGLSAVTAHTNITFDNLLQRCSAESRVHQSLAETFSLVVELIQKKGGQESNAEYCTAFLHLLEVVEAPEKVESVLILLYHILPKISTAFLRKTFPRVCKKLVGYLETYSNSEFGQLVRNALQVLAHYLRVQELAVWQLPNTQHLFSVLLDFCTHIKPNTRKVAQEAVASIVRSSNIMAEPNSPQFHPVVPKVVKYCEGIISSKTSPQVPRLHALGLLEKVLPGFTPSWLQSSCEGLLAAMTDGDKLLMVKCLRVLNTLFNSETHLTAELTAKLINALYERKPDVNSEDLIICWLTSQTSALLCLYKLNKDLVLLHLNKFFKVSTDLWAKGPHYGVHTDLVTFLQKLVNSILMPLLEADLAKVTPTVKALFATLQSCLQPDYKLAMPHVLKMLANLMESFGSRFPVPAAGCLKSLTEMADHGTECQAEVDAVVAKALSNVGPRWVLKIFPVTMSYDGLQKEFHFPRAWLLPLLKNHVRNSELQIFHESIAPVISALEVKLSLASSQAHMSHYKLLETLHYQLWAIFPAFCHGPSDVAQTLPKLVPTIGPVLQNGKELRMFIMAGLRHLANHCRENEEARVGMAPYVTKFASVLFNSYISPNEQSSIRNAGFETIRLLLAITKPTDIQALYNTVSKKLSNCPAEDKFTKFALLDLVQVFVPHLSEEELLQLEHIFVPLIKTVEQVDKQAADKDSKVTSQKKGYRLMEELCKCPSETCKSVVLQKLEDLQRLYLDGLLSALPTSKASRLRTFACLLHIQETPAHDFVENALPEVMLSVRESSTRTREAGYAAVVATGKAFLRWWPNSPPHENLDKLALLLLPGFGGDSYQIATTILCCAKFLAEFRKQVAPATLQSMVSAATTLLQSESNEVVHACLTFLRVLLTCFSSLELHSMLPSIITGLASISTQRMRRFRFKAKEILVKLIRMFGMDEVASLVPETHKKVLANIRRTEARKARRRAGLMEDAATEDDATISQSWEENNTKYTALSMHSFEDIIGNLSLDDDEKMTRKTARTIKKAARRNAPKVFLRDGLNVNLADPSIMSNILTSRPGSARPAPQPQARKEVFKINPDGKLLILESDDEEEKLPQKRKRETSTVRSIMSKKKWAAMEEEDSDDDSEDDDFSDIAKSYKSGGSRKSKVSFIGQKYRSKKGSGDCQKKHALEPHDYIPLERSKKGKVKTSKLKSIFAGASKGAKKGVALKRKQRRMKKNN